MDPRYIIYFVAFSFVLYFGSSFIFPQVSKYRELARVFIFLILFILDSFDTFGGIAFKNNYLYITGTTKPLLFGSERLYVAKYSMQGRLIRFKKYRIEGDSVKDINVNRDNNLYISNVYSVYKIDPRGNLLWIKNKVSADKILIKRDRLYLLGLSDKQISVNEALLSTGKVVKKINIPTAEDYFDAKPIYLNRNNQIIWNDGEEIFAIICANIEGKKIWTNTVAGKTEVNSITSDKTNNIFIVGGSNDTKILNGKKTKGWFDAFVTKLDANGKKLWTGCYGTDGPDAATDVLLDNNNDIVIAGWKSTRTRRLSAVNRRIDTFVSKFNQNGKCLWNKVLKIHNWQENSGKIVIDGNDNIYVAGDYSFIKLNKYGEKIWEKLYINRSTKLYLLFMLVFLDIAFWVKSKFSRNRSFSACDKWQRKV